MPFNSYEDDPAMEAQDIRQAKIDAMLTAKWEDSDVVEQAITEQADIIAGLAKKLRDNKIDDVDFTTRVFTTIDSYLLHDIEESV